MKNLSFFSLLFMAGMLLFVSGCQREEVLTEKKSSPEQKLFFENDEYFSKYFPNIQTNQLQTRNEEFEEHLNLIKNKLKSLDESDGIITKIISNYGMPLWGRPILADKLSSNLQFAYSFPLLNQNNPLVNGVLVASMSQNNHLNFQIQNDLGVFNLTKSNYDPFQLISWISLFYQHNLNIFEEYKKYQSAWIFKLSQENENLVRPRNSDCYMDVVIQTTINVHMGGVNIHAECDDFSGTHRAVGPIAYITLVTVTVPIPDCTTNGDYVFTEIINQQSGGGDGLTPQSQWERLNEINRIKLMACRSWAPDATGGVDVISDSPGTDADLATDCEIIRLLDECLTSGMLSDINIINLLSAIDLGIVSESDLKFIQRQHCGSETIDQAITKFLECVMVTQSNNPFPDVDFKKYIESFKAIEEFLSAHPNDDDAAQFAVEMKQSLCGGASSPCLTAVGSFNTTYGTDFTAIELYELVGGFGNTCGDQDEFDEIVFDVIMTELNIPNSIKDELSNHIIGSIEWIEVLSIEYPGESWRNAWNRLTEQEKVLANAYPMAALVIFGNKSKAENMAQSLFPNGQQHNDKADAFRHAYFNALNVRHIQSAVVENFGLAHESGTHPDFQLEVEMDIFNNTIGRVLGNQNYNKNDNELADIVKNELDIGGLKYLKPINYNDPCYWSCPTDNNGNHGISTATKLIKTNL